ncbi:MAG: PaaI family thioesterase, partial [Dehalococcoidia bacterium]
NAPAPGPPPPSDATNDWMPRRLTPEWRARWREQPFHRYLDLDIDEQADGYCRISMRASERTIGGVGGSVHGGIMATLVDIAAINAIASLIGPGETMAGTAELNISYLRPALSPVVVGEGRVLKKGRSLVFVDVDCSDGHGTLFARGRVVYALRQQLDARIT